MISSTYNNSVTKRTIALCVCVFLLAGCSSDDNAALCESHYNANSYQVALKYCHVAAEDGDGASQYYLGLIYIKQGQKEKGAEAIAESADSGFDKAVFHQTVSQLLRSDSLEVASKAVEKMQKYAEAGDDVAQFWMGNVFLFGYAEQKISPNEASYWYELSVKQGNYRAMNNLAWIKALARDSDLFDPQGAILLAEKVVAKYPDSHGYIDTLSAAYAANEQFDKAVESQRNALRLAQAVECESCVERLIKYYKKHLELYLQEKPLEEDLLK